MKQLLTIFIICIATTAQSQVFTEISLTNKGYHMGAGVMANGAGFNVGYHVPLTSAEIPRMYYAAALYEVNLSHKDSDNYTATATAGVASHSYTEAGKYMGKVNKITGIYGVELGKDWFMGRLYISANYSERLYLGAGMKIIFR